MLSLSALNLSEYRTYTKGWKPNPQLLELFERHSKNRGKKAYRVYFDYTNDREPLIKDAPVPPNIAKYFRDNNFTVLDYVAGTVQDKHSRVMRIGKVLSKQADLKKVFDNDPHRRQLVTASKGNKLVCISMHPYDIAGMSTDRGWSSCMNIRTGSNKKYVRQDIKSNTLIAYLVNPDDKNINNPIMRVLLKKYTNANGSSSRYLTEVVYPDASDKIFLTKVQEWVDENINAFTDKSSSPSILERKSGLYVDGDSELGVMTLSRLEELADIGFEKLESVLDNLLARKKSIADRRKDREEFLYVDNASAKKLFKIAPTSIKYPKLRKLIPQFDGLWVDAIANRPDKKELLVDAFKTFKTRKADKRTAIEIISIFAARGDIDALTAISKVYSMTDFLDSGETDFKINRMLKPGKGFKVYTFAKTLANFSNNPEIYFWKILAMVCTKGASLNDEEGLFYNLGAYHDVAKQTGEFLDSATLNKAKKVIPKTFYKFFDLILNSTHTLILTNYDELGALTYSTRRRAYGNIVDFVKSYTPKINLSLVDRDEDNMAFVFDKKVDRKKFIEALIPATIGGISKSVVIPNGRYDSELDDIVMPVPDDPRNGYSVKIICSNRDCVALFSEDVSGAPIATIYGEEYDIEEVMEALESLGMI